MTNASTKTDRKKPKLVRDSFTIPKAEYAALDALKTRAIAQGNSVKKSELLRAGLLALQAMTDAQFKSAVAAVPQLKTGRPAAQSASDAAAPAPVAAPAAKKAPRSGATQPKALATVPTPTPAPSAPPAAKPVRAARKSAVAAKGAPAASPARGRSKPAA